MDTSPPPVPLRTIFLAFLQVGLTAYGMAILQKLRALVVRRGWLTAEDANEGLAMVQLYPGSIMVDFTAYVGYRLRGVPGALLAVLGFVLPAFVLVVLLSAFGSGMAIISVLQAEVVQAHGWVSQREFLDGLAG